MKKKVLPEILAEIYYNPKTGYGGVQSLYRQLRARDIPFHYLKLEIG